MTDHIAGGIDMRHCGLVGFAVNFNPAAVVGFKPHRCEIEMWCRAQTAGRKKQYFSTRMAAVFQSNLDMLGAGLSAEALERFAADYERDGCAVVRGVFDAQQLGAITAEVERLVAALAEASAGFSRQDIHRTQVLSSHLSRSAMDNASAAGVCDLGARHVMLLLSRCATASS